MSNLTILRSYAQKSNPTSLPPSVLFTHTSTSLTIFDAYPKVRRTASMPRCKTVLIFRHLIQSIFHFLILPSVTPPLSVFDLASLRTLLKADKAKAKEVLTGLAEDAKTVKGMIEEEMMKRYGFKWNIWVGFHSVQSMEHLHLHVLSADLCSPSMKLKKHYNSFNPKHGFFLHLDEVLSWLDAEPSYFQTVRFYNRSAHSQITIIETSVGTCLRAHFTDGRAEEKQF